MPLGNGTGVLFSRNPAEGSPTLRSGPRIGRDDRKRGTSACTPATSSRSEQFSGPLSLACANLGRWTLPSSSRCRGSGRSASCVPTWGSWLSTADRRTGAPRRWRVAPRSGRALSYYAILQPPDLRVHLTSRLHNPDHSATLQAFLNHVDIAISVHGFGREGFALWFDDEHGLVIEPYGPALQGKQTGPLRGIIVGGLNAELLDSARQLFQGRFAGYHVADERIRLGFHPDNPVNLPSAHGVQVELPPGLRGIGDFGEIWVPRQDRVVLEMVAALVDLAARASALLRTAGVAKRLDVSRGTP